MIPNNPADKMARMVGEAVFQAHQCADAHTRVLARTAFFVAFAWRHVPTLAALDRLVQRTVDVALDCAGSDASATLVHAMSALRYYYAWAASQSDEDADIVRIHCEECARCATAAQHVEASP